MRNNKKLGIFGGNEKFLEAIIGNDKPLRETEADPGMTAEAKRQDAQDDAIGVPIQTQADMNRDHREHRAIERRQRFGYRPQKSTQKRKGHIRNHVEARTIRHLSK